MRFQGLPDSGPRAIPDSSVSYAVRHAFKEWAIIVDALMRGEQIIILRKGGLIEGHGGFQVEHPEFLLFPTLFHQQRESVLPEAQARFDQIAHLMPEPTVVRLECFARVEAWQRLESVSAACALRGLHIWRDDVIKERFDWGRTKQIHAMAVRIFRLAAPVELPMRESYGGCKSWIELAEDINTVDAHAVLDDGAFAAQLLRFNKALDPVANFAISS
jgi:hypothetical protein